MSGIVVSHNLAQAHVFEYKHNGVILWIIHNLYSCKPLR
jgi:hypothetical protein